MYSKEALYRAASCETVAYLPMLLAYIPLSVRTGKGSPSQRAHKPNPAQQDLVWVGSIQCIKYDSPERGWIMKPPQVCFLLHCVSLFFNCSCHVHTITDGGSCENSKSPRIQASTVSGIVDVLGSVQLSLSLQLSITLVISGYFCRAGSLEVLFFLCGFLIFHQDRVLLV